MDASALANAESWLYWIGIAKLAAAFFVAAGVAIEFGGDWVARPYERIVENARQAELASLRSDAAEANARAQESSLALAKLKAPREIGPAQQAAIVAAASRHPRLPLDIFLLGDSPDIRPISTTISGLVKKGGNWPVEVWTWTGVSPITGIAVLVKSGASPGAVAAADELVQAISGGQVVNAQVWPDKWENFGGLLNGPPFDAKRTEIRVVIGLKPV